jgi:hypothetical protein
LGEKGSIGIENIKQKSKKKEEEGEGSRFGTAYGYELRLRCVKLHLEKEVAAFFGKQGGGSQQRYDFALGEGAPGTGRNRDCGMK